jgi:subtilisin family serine protease
VTKNKWKSDNGAMEDTLAVIGRSSEFSSLGPTRDGREKPEISAPGQYVTAALAKDSEMQDWDDRSLDSKRQLTIEGTSMSAPVVTGVVALMLQKKTSLTPDKVRTILKQSASRDDHTGSLGWNPTYGHGKIDVVKIIANT